MNIEKNLILIKGQDRTKNIRIWKYVDGYMYHNQNSKQSKRDKLKDEILRKYNISFARFKTNERNEKQRLIEMLNQVL